MHMCISVNDTLFGMADLKENLANNVRARRGKKTQAAFAKRIGLHQSSVNRIETGRQNVTIDTLQALCDRLRCSAGDLLDHSEEQ